MCGWLCREDIALGINGVKALRQSMLEHGVEKARMFIWLK